VRRCAYKHFSLVLCCEGFLNPASLTQRDEAQRIEVQYRVSVSALSLSPTALSVYGTTWGQAAKPVRSDRRSTLFKTRLLATLYKEARHFRNEKVSKSFEPRFLTTNGRSVAK